VHAGDLHGTSHRPSASLENLPEDNKAPQERVLLCLYLKQYCALCRGLDADHPDLCSNIMFICGMSARGRTEFYQPIVEHMCSIPDPTHPDRKLLM